MLQNRKQVNPHLLAMYQRTAQRLSLVVTGLGILVLVGWALDIAALKSVFSGLATMKFNTALLFVLAGISLATFRRSSNRLGEACAIAVVVIAGLTLLQYALGWNLGIDELLVEDLDTAAEDFPGRMSLMTAVIFFVIGSGLLLIRQNVWLAQITALSASILSMVAFIGYIYEVDALYHIDPYSSMALHTATAFCLITLGMLLATPDAGLLGILVSDSLGGYMFRRLLPTAIFVPPIISGLVLEGEKLGLYEYEFGSALTTTAFILILTVIIRRAAGSLHQVDIQRTETEIARQHLLDEMEDRVVARTTELAEVNETLSASEAQFKGLLESAPDAIVIVDEDGTIVLVNIQAQNLFGYAAEELIGKPVEILVPASFRQRHPEHRARYSSDPHPRPMGADMELYALRKDGGEFPVEISLSPLKTDEGMLVSSAIRDITERIQSAQQIQDLNSQLKQQIQERNRQLIQLEAVNKELESFSYSVSHDLRAPLRAVNGFGQALLEDYQDKLDEEGQDYLRLMRAESQRMGQLIDDLLNLSHFTRTELHWQPVDLSALVHEIVEALQNQEPDRDVEFTIQDTQIVCGDSRLLKVALQNLIDNAWKYSSKQASAHITFGVTNIDDEVVYLVQDDGVGFDMTYVNKLFGAFQRLHSNTEFEGTGIGLATVQRIIHRHGGTVRAESDQDAGATFYFTLGKGNCE